MAPWDPFRCEDQAFFRNFLDCFLAENVKVKPQCHIIGTLSGWEGGLGGGGGASEDDSGDRSSVVWVQIIPKRIQWTAIRFIRPNKVRTA